MSYDDIKKNEATIHNIRLWDHRPLVQTYKQLQEIRLYYDFNSVDVDRYHFNDKYTQVAVAGRELPPSQLPARARTWVNMHLVYTHGYGVVMSPVNKFTPDGMPDFIMQDIPPKSSTPLRVTRPEIYYGKETDGFAIVHSRTKEFDYPKGDQNAYTFYQGKGGVQISSFFRRLAYAVDLSDVNVLLSSYITDQSRLMLHRRIADRVRTIAPFLAYDSDPYIVVGADGRLYWIQDAYTTSTMFPYSEPIPDPGSEASTTFATRLRWSSMPITAMSPTTSSTRPIRWSRPTARSFPPCSSRSGRCPRSCEQHMRYPMDLFLAPGPNVRHLPHDRPPGVLQPRGSVEHSPGNLQRHAAIDPALLHHHAAARLPATKNSS